MLFARPLAPLGGNQRSRTPEICPVAGIAPALAASIIWDNRNLNGGQARNHSGIIRVCASPSQPGFFLSTSPRLGADCPRGFRSLTDRKPVIGRIGFRRQAGNKQDVQVMQHSPVLDTRVPDIDLELSGEAWVARYFPYGTLQPCGSNRRCAVGPGVPRGPIPESPRGHNYALPRLWHFPGGIRSWAKNIGNVRKYPN